MVNLGLTVGISVRSDSEVHLATIRVLLERWHKETREFPQFTFLFRAVLPSVTPAIQSNQS